GRVDGCALRLGRADAVLDGAVPPALGGCLVLADTAGPLAGFRPREQLRQDAVDTLAALQAQGVQVALASGDAPPRVATIAAALGIGQYAAQQTPADKLALLRQARDRGHVTLAVGDGSNDAPVLAGADVSAALAGGTALAQAHAGLLLAGDRLDGLLAARAVAGDMRRIVAQSRRWALGYNLVAVPFAAFGLVPPWLAGIGMALSSLGVVLNALRTGRRLPVPGWRA
ncbi:HAD-IC family P-type ATPase, partial [Dyella ginsengisoli]|uniref:HAD-IC family P-type ATPase n=1 Tax=Dyella ginsengisoli TaxID=363848 RepID=UPI0005BDA216